MLFGLVLFDPFLGEEGWGHGQNFMEIEKMEESYFGYRSVGYR